MVCSTGQPISSDPIDYVCHISSAKCWISWAYLYLFLNVDGDLPVIGAIRAGRIVYSTNVRPTLPLRLKLLLEKSSSHASSEALRFMRKAGTTSSTFEVHSWSSSGVPQWKWEPWPQKFGLRTRTNPGSIGESSVHVPGR